MNGLLFFLADWGFVNLIAYWRSNANISRQSGERRRMQRERQQVRRALLRLGEWRSLWPLGGVA
ncbi:hypothetical protein [Myxococcus sp. NMCA1]|uniref:hypothetical protein n=1 Tax=Myxococcus sp. NMCA1 TaxID=2996785 RepID=UPI00228659A4|nr:hypothetical protein [Myxococcus sp. NMCA1]WAM23845.1 hypothetical protein OZ403_25220 [Myxococcus sp. NMCA1]